MGVVSNLALAAACAMFASAGDAQCRLCEQPTVAGSAAASSGDVELQIETNLSFDRMILAGDGAGAATIRPDGSSGVEGSVVELGPRATVGTVVVHGGPNRTVRIDVPRRIQLFSLAGGEMILDDIVTDVPAISHLDSAGKLSFRLGGRIILSGDCDGPYRGDLPITVEYQ